MVIFYVMQCSSVPEYLNGSGEIACSPVVKWFCCAKDETKNEENNVVAKKNRESLSPAAYLSEISTI